MRYNFGKNWAHYVDGIDGEFDQTLDLAKQYLCDVFGIEKIIGKSFIDVGSGSGLFSLAAVELGAARVLSIDYDPDSVMTTNSLKDKTKYSDEKWAVIQGDLLDKLLVDKLGTFDLVHCAGVAHHTGEMMLALANLDNLVAKNGYLFESIYNRISIFSSLWHKIKYLYNKFRWLRPLIKISYVVSWFLYWMFNRKWPLTEVKNFGKNGRGMNFYRDIDDWLGGYPYEYANAGEIVNFYFSKDYDLTYFVASNNWGLNNFVFRQR